VAGDALRGGRIGRVGRTDPARDKYAGDDEDEDDDGALPPQEEVRVNLV
jgi:hypothetical protein